MFITQIRRQERLSYIMRISIKNSIMVQHPSEEYSIIALHGIAEWQRERGTWYAENTVKQHKELMRK